MSKNILQFAFLFLVPLMVFAEKEYEWNTVIIGGGGYVTGIITCPTEQNLIYIRTDVGGSYRWEEVGERWIPLNDWISVDEMGYLGIESIAIDPQDPNRVYMSAGLEYFSTPSAILYSDDYGNTFQKSIVPFQVHGNGYGRGVGERLVVDPNESSILFCGSRQHGLYKSVDTARSWTKVNSFPISTTPNGNGICFVLFDASSGEQGTPSQTLYVGVSRMNDTNLYVSYNAGISWKGLPGQRTDYAPQRLVITPDSIFYISYANGAGPHGHWNSSLNEPLDAGALMKYNSKTGTWTDVSPTGQNNIPISGISFQQDNPDVLIASTTNTWWAQRWSPSGTVWGDEIFSSDDGGETWIGLFGQNKTILDVGEFEWGDPAVFDDPVSLHWTTDIKIDPFNPERVFVVSGNGIFMTNNIYDAQSTWHFQVRNLEETVPLDIISPWAGAPLLSVIGDYDGFRHDYLDKSPSLGRYNPPIGSTGAIDFAELNPNVVMRAGSNALYSHDNGQTWTNLPDPVSGAENGSVAVAADGMTLAWCPQGKTVYTTKNRTNWEISTGAPTGARIIADRVNPDKFYLVYSRALYYSFDGGQTFTKGPTNSQLQNIRKYRAAPSYEGDVWIPCGSYGLHKTEWTGGTPGYIKIDAISNCEAIGFGKAAIGSDYPAIYIWGTVDGTEGIFRSDDTGDSWERVNDDDHEFGGTGNANEVIGDPRIYGRVYMSTAGRGIVYCDLIDGPDYGVVADPTPPDIPVLSLEEISIENIGQRSFTIESRVFTDQTSVASDIGGTYRVFDLSGTMHETGIFQERIEIGVGLKAGYYILQFIDNKGVITTTTITKLQ
jgi:xyloglucan-specific exo-beta-1,4-glucanase